MYVAAKQSRLEVLKRLLQCGANPNVGKVGGPSPLYCAAHQKSPEACKVGHTATYVVCGAAGGW